MSKKAKRILAIVALVFMGVFTITFIIWLSAPHLLNGQFGYWALFSGSMGIGLFLIVKLVKTPQEKQEEIDKLLSQQQPDEPNTAQDTQKSDADKAVADNSSENEAVEPKKANSQAEKPKQ